MTTFLVSRDFMVLAVNSIFLGHRCPCVCPDLSWAVTLPGSSQCNPATKLQSLFRALTWTVWAARPLPQLPCASPRNLLLSLFLGLFPGRLAFLLAGALTLV